MKNIISTEICKKCGECCRNYPFIELSENDINSLEELTTLHFDVFANPKSSIAEGYFLQFREYGDCFFLNENNGNYSCGVYEARPEICKNYPSKSIQKEACYANRRKISE